MVLIIEESPMELQYFYRDHTCEQVWNLFDGDEQDDEGSNNWKYSVHRGLFTVGRRRNDNDII